MLVSHYALSGCVSVTRASAAVSVVLAFFTATSAAQDQVLRLDGDGDYVELPSGIFQDLTEATIEAWIRWDDFGYFSQPIGFGVREGWRALAINNAPYSPTLHYFIHVGMERHLIIIPEILRLGHWYHIAAVSGHGGMKLYLNGVLVGSDPYGGSFDSIATTQHCYLGKPHWAANADFKGCLDEVRVWSMAKSDDEIRRSRHQHLRGDESGLAGWWTFDGGDAADSSSHRSHGVLRGDARCAEADLAGAGELPRPIALSGVVADVEGARLPNATVTLEHDYQLVVAGSTDDRGNFRLVTWPRPGEGD
ncbi:hypothetical protein JXA88_01880 [Candidatus Fermentibacteria bacterium]|nr:hypothetical protein [Candidatus Fermentibacteria bacterium]